MGTGRAFDRRAWWATLKARGIHRFSATYLITGWLVLEVGHILSLILELPHVVMRVVLGLLVLGFPIGLLGAWHGRWFAAEQPGDAPGPPGHGAHGGGSVDPMPIVVGGLVLAAILFVGAARLFGIDLSGDHGADKDHGTAAAHGPATAGETHAEPARPKAAPPNSIAVLAFANLSGDPAQEYFSDGLSEELIDALSRLSGMQVAARASSFSFKGKAADAATIGSRLNIAWLLDGSVRRSGDKLRVSAELVDARTGLKAWSATYDRELDDIFVVQQGIAAAVASALRVRFSGTPGTAAPGGTTDRRAYDAYLHGRQLVDLSGSEPQWREALRKFDEAIAADPRYAVAHAARARALIALANAFLPAAEVRRTYELGLASARRAVELAPELADAQSTLGYTLVSANLDFAGAAEPFRKSLAEGSGSAAVLIRYGLFATRVGDADAGLRALAKAVELDPLNPRAHRSLAVGLYVARRHADSIATMRAALALSPGMTLAHSVIGDNLVALGRVDEAADAYQLEPVDWARLTGLAVVAARRGETTASRELLARLNRLDGLGSRYQQAQILAQLGDTRGALGMLKAARVSGDVGLVSLRGDALLDPVRRLPGYAALAAELFGPAART